MQYIDENDIRNFQKLNILSWDTVKDNVYVRLINEKYLTKYGEDIAYVKFLDLAITFSLQEKNKGQMVCHMLTNQEITHWNIDLNTVKEAALHNTAYDRKRRIMTFKESTLKNNVMYPILRIPTGMMMGAGGTSIADCGIVQDTDEKQECANILMLCHKHDVFGAAYIVIPEVLEEICTRFNGENFYVIPLSIHQVMCVRDSYVSHNGEKPLHEVEDDLLDMIESFNDSHNTSWKDILSYKIYYYFGNDGKVLFPIT